MKDQLLNYLDNVEYYNNTRLDYQEESTNEIDYIKENLELMVKEYMEKQKQK